LLKPCAKTRRLISRQTKTIFMVTAEAEVRRRQGSLLAGVVFGVVSDTAGVELVMVLPCTLAGRMRMAGESDLRAQQASGPVRS
jgi:hypothetical protein